MEIWRDVPGYVGFYQVSDEGRVRSLKRVTEAATRNGIRVPVRVLKQGEECHGRKQVTFCMWGEIKRFLVHRLVLKAFVGEPDEGQECRHIDGDHTNNRIDNLRWGTHTENMRDKVHHGTNTEGAKHYRAKLTEEDVKAIRISDLPQRLLGLKYGVSQVAIHFIKSGKSWKHLN